MTPKEDAFYSIAKTVASLRSKLQVALQRKADADAIVAALQAQIDEQEAQAKPALDAVVDERIATRTIMEI
jgi:hypothetical protein